ncbi:DHA2 family efflux MFS transporter permease subunit [Pseudonocardia spinosispora]|uniref:DHA2 family efflux MFS transporter permease subunit n=1 Tax=Pseudonocardia spinosispora TaxID=103441 RepID=UPI00146F9B43|nr:DHA2 family efflux MFS transporter permease subunit [Pseudonocardia spinosispora]
MSERKAEQGWLLPLSVLIVGAFMSVLDTSIVNVAVPKIQIELSAAPDDVEWIVTGFTLALGIVVPVSGWLGARLGMSRLYILSMLGFALASALCGMAWNLESMIIFRVLQAIPGGILPVVSMTMMYQVVPLEKIGAAMGIYGLGVVVAPAVGPVLGGYLVEYVDWRLIFFINVPIGLLGTLAALAVFPRDRPTSWPRFDLWGFVTIAYGLAALLLALSEGQDWGWDGFRIRGLIVSGVLSLALYVVIELEVDNPLIDLRIFKVWAYTNSILLLGIAVTGLFAVLYFLPQFLQVVQGMQALDAGLVLVPSAAVLVVLMPIAGRIYDRFGPRWPVVIGLSIMAYGSFLMAGMTPDTPRADLEIWTFIRNVGVGLAMMPIFASGVSSLPAALTGAGSGMNNVMQRVASSVAVAVFSSLSSSAAAQLMNDRGSLFASGAQSLPAVADAREQGAPGLLGLYQTLNLNVLTETYNNGFYIVGLLCVAGIALALTMRSGPAKTTGGPVHVEV